MNVNNLEGGKPVRRIICCLTLALAVLLLALGIFHDLQRTEPSVSAGTGSAALGLMLLDQQDGVYVLAVTENSVADASGVRPGDYLLRVGEEALASAETFDLLLDERTDSIVLTLRRDGAEVTVTLPGR